VERERDKERERGMGMRKVALWQRAKLIPRKDLWGILLYPGSLSAGPPDLPCLKRLSADISAQLVGSPNFLPFSKGPVSYTPA
jgi:hypothetical protein